MLLKKRRRRKEEKKPTFYLSIHSFVYKPSNKQKNKQK